MHCCCCCRAAAEIGFILFAIPPIKCRDKNIPYYWQNVSEDGTYKNMSYHLFKGLKKSKWNIKRKKLTENGDCEYTDEYMKEFNEKNGHEGFAPCAFTDGGHDLFTYKQFIMKQSYTKTLAAITAVPLIAMNISSA